MQTKEQERKFLLQIIDMGKYFDGLKPYYYNRNAALYLSDTFDALERMLPDTVDMIFIVN